LAGRMRFYRRVSSYSVPLAVLVTAFVRNPDRLLFRHSLLRVLQGDIPHAETIQAAVPARDAVLSALGTRSLGPATLLSEAAREIAHFMLEEPTSRAYQKQTVTICY